MNKIDALKRFFGHYSFRPGQERIVDTLLSGRDVLAVMPTGAGKSVCFQLPALLLPGITLVISPLISLMKDQVASLQQSGIAAACLNSSLSAEEYASTMRFLRDGYFKILYVAPERLLTPGFLELISSFQISMIAVDEAHCVSQWGQDFRPSYLQIPEFVQRLQKRPIIGAFTATATHRVKEDIEQLLRLEHPFPITTGFDRPNLYFDVVQPLNKETYLISWLRQRKEQFGVIYCATRKCVDQLYIRLLQEGFQVGRYHAGLNPEDRKKSQADFDFDRIQILVATNAFGMGIDKSNVNFVVHYQMPKDLESYYQEAGRAGRDGSAAQCILLYSGGDVAIQRYMIENSEENDLLTAAEQENCRKRQLERLKVMVGYCTTSHCFRNFILHYFGEQTQEDCGNCGNCLRHPPIKKPDMTITAQKILSAAARMERKHVEQTDAELLMDVLSGKKNDRVISYGLEHLPTFGILKCENRQQLSEEIHLLLENEYLTGTAEKLKLGSKAENVLFHGEKVFRKESKTPFSAKVPSFFESISADIPADLVLRLKQLRMQISIAEQIPAYVIFTNPVLDEIAVRQPTDMASFRSIPDISQSRAERYGERFIQEIIAWRKEK